MFMVLLLGKKVQGQQVVRVIRGSLFVPPQRPLPPKLEVALFTDIKKTRMANLAGGGGFAGLYQPPNQAQMGKKPLDSFMATSFVWCLLSSSGRSRNPLFLNRVDSGASAGLRVWGRCQNLEPKELPAASPPSSQAVAGSHRAARFFQEKRKRAGHFAGVS